MITEKRISLGEILNKDGIILKNKENEIDVNPLKIEIIKFDERLKQKEGIYLEEKREFEIFLGRPLIH